MRYLFFTLLISLSACQSAPLQPSVSTVQRLSTAQNFRFSRIQNFKAQVQSGKPYARISVDYDVVYGDKASRRHVAFFYHKDKSISDVSLLEGESATAERMLAECHAIMRLPLSPN